MTKEEIGLVLKELRISCGMTQKEVAEKLGRKQQIVGHWETGYAQPDANTLFTLCNIYGVTVDDAFGFQRNNNISKEEYDHIKKYRDLDPHGKKMVDFTLNEEWERSTEEAKSENKIVPMMSKDDPRYVNAAHADDYENAPEELKQLEEDMINQSFLGS